MKTVTLFLCRIFAGCSTSVNNQDKLPLQVGLGAEGFALDFKIEKLMAREDVKGLAIAVIAEEKITHLAAFGLCSVEALLKRINEQFGQRSEA